MNVSIVIDRIVASAVRPQTQLEAVVAFLHSYIKGLTEFRYVAEIVSNTPGFKNSIKEIPNTTFLANGWNNDASTISLLFKCSHKPRDLFSLMVSSYRRW